MKKILMAALALLITVIAGCSCQKVQSTPSELSVPVSSAPSITTPSQNVTIGDDFVARTFEINAKSTADWVKFKTLSDPIAVYFSLWIPPEWIATEDATYYISTNDKLVYTSAVTLKDAAGRTVCEVLAPILMTETQEMPDIPGEKATELGAVSSAAEVGLSNMRGKCVVRQITENSATVYVHQYFMQDDDIVYRMTFRSYTGDEADRDLFNAIMDRLVNGK